MITELFAKGGPFMYLLVLAGLLHMLVVVAQLPLCRKVDLRPLLWSGVMAMALIGFLGTISGQIQAFKAVGAASAEMKQSLLASGIAISLYTTAFGLSLAAIGATATGLAATIVAKFHD
jgi:hypothetical protein